MAGILLAGSVAPGLADDFSDVEVDMFWHVPPSDDDRRQPLQRNGWELIATADSRASFEEGRVVSHLEDRIE